MTRKIAIHQPNYLPWLGLFKKISLADILIILDDVPFSKDSYTQRTKIRNKDGWQWLTVPVSSKCYGVLIKDIPLLDVDNWRKKHLKGIFYNYSKTPFFDAHYPFFEEYYSYDQRYLSEFNVQGLIYLLNEFQLDQKTYYSSDLIQSEKKGTDYLIDLVESVGGTHYISGMGGKKYLDEQKFSEHDLVLEYSKFDAFTYSQRWSPFVHNLSAIDYLFNTNDYSLMHF